MPVEKYRSLEEMGSAPVRPRTATGFERFVRHCARIRKLRPRSYPKGVFKFKSYEEAQSTHPSR